jgi:hypothetical protein
MFTRLSKFFVRKSQLFIVKHFKTSIPIAILFCTSTMLEKSFFTKIIASKPFNTFNSQSLLAKNHEEKIDDISGYPLEKQHVDPVIIFVHGECDVRIPEHEGRWNDISQRFDDVKEKSIRTDGRLVSCCVVNRNVRRSRIGTN